MITVDVDANMPWPQWSKLYEELPPCACGHRPGRHMAYPPRRCGVTDCSCQVYRTFDLKEVRSELLSMMHMLDEKNS